MSKMLPDVEINDTKPIKMIHDDKSPNVWADISYEVREAAMDSSIHGLSGIYRYKNLLYQIGICFNVLIKVRRIFSSK